ncbi:signal transduction histidine kinase [Leptolyngbya sp. Heron Island J]|uniref:hybrid sensor histidine kinase/response regulator n=1 Tax=Leptolyngbya sp. Heron Island J TaxID=1385935 RepID=UPI0003B9AD0B|nr:Hpt domain-containing protein [Leptolyngbya sp. Heron Island J]ESA35683.1 signal transduction histidine kinase [Leptolyngbya sp. Heron Island J]
MMIQDEELRSLYQETSTQRLNNLQSSLLQLEEDPHNPTILEDIRREIHSLKGDSKVIGLDTVAILAQELEEVVKALQQQHAEFTLDISDCFYQGMYAISQLVHEVVTGEPIDIDYNQTLDFLKAVAASTTVTPVASPDSTTKTLYIRDDELREIYRITSDSRLQALKASLQELGHSPDDATTIEVLRRETHSLKGDSRAVDMDEIGDLVHVIEKIVNDLQHQTIPFSAQVGSCLKDGLEAIDQLVREATTGEPSHVVLPQVFERLGEITTALESPALEAPGVTLPEPEMISSASVIADPELRQIYQTTTEERLQTLESNLLYLEQNPDDQESLSVLLREAHSLKGDARSAGLKSVEALTHRVEDILIGIQSQTLELDATVSDRLYEGLDAISYLAYEAVTGVSANVDTKQLLETLAKVLPAATTTIDVEPETIASPLEPTPETEPPSPATSNKDTPQTDTLRVQLRDLDALTTQAEELAVTRIQIAQTSTQTEQLMTLWDEWQANKGKPQAVSGPSYEERLETLILNLRSTLQTNSTKLELVSEELRNQVRRLQLLPLSTLFQPLQRVVRDLAKQQSKAINLVVEGAEATSDKRLLEGIKDSLMHLVRNAIDHGIETSAERETLGKPAAATLRLKAYQTAISLIIEITDDGRGLDLEKIKQTAIKRKLYSSAELDAMSTSQIQRLILAPGFSTRNFITEISGRGVGLDVVRNQVENLKGSIQIESTPAQGTTFRLQLSTALSTANVVLVETQGMMFAVPIEFLKTTLLVSPQQIVTTDGEYTIMLGDEAVPVANLTDVLELSSSPIYDWVAKPGLSVDDTRPCMILNVGHEQAGFFIDRLISQQEVVSKPLGKILKRVRNVSGTTVLGSGEICMILNPPDLLKSLQQQSLSETLATNKANTQKKPVILLVEDSPPVRIQEKRLFEGAGYVVVTANNGLEGYNTLQSGIFDAVVSDVEMPYLDGFSLATKIRQHQKFDNLPIILVTTLDSAADRQRGADAGANAYILKGRFNQEALLETLGKLI